jgi:phosphoribosylanthranilate isomerase
MSLRYPVKINRVNNLSDARYCAGMFVDIIGITNEVSATEIAAMAGWITGVDLCLDVYNSSADLTAVLQNVNVLYVEIADEALLAQLENYKVIFRFENCEFDEILAVCNRLVHKVFAFNIASENISKNNLVQLAQSYEIILSADSLPLEDLDGFCADVKPAYLALNGGNEIAPGLKSFDTMADVLEFLEIED